MQIFLVTVNCPCLKIIRANHYVGPVTPVTIKWKKSPCREIANIPRNGKLPLFENYKGKSLYRARDSRDNQMDKKLRAGRLQIFLVTVKCPCLKITKANHYVGPVMPRTITWLLFLEILKNCSPFCLQILHIKFFANWSPKLILRPMALFWAFFFEEFSSSKWQSNEKNSLGREIANIPRNSKLPLFENYKDKSLCRVRDTHDNQMDKTLRAVENTKMLKMLEARMRWAPQASYSTEPRWLWKHC